MTTPPTPSAQDRQQYRIGFWLAVGAAFGFSFKAIFVKLAYAIPLPSQLAVDAVTLLMLRMFFAAPFFGLMAYRARSSQTLTLRQWLALIGVGLAGYYGASLFDFLGLQYITASLERLILFTYPTLTLLLGLFFFGRPLHGRDWLAIGLTYLGILIAFAHDLEVSGQLSTVLLGAGLVLASSLSYAVYLSVGGQLITKLGSARFTALAMGVATTATLLHYLLTRPLGDVIGLPWSIYALAFAMAMISTVFPVFMQSAAIRRMGAERASLVGMVGPLLTIAFGWVILKEPMTVWQLTGAGFVIGGILLISRR